MDNQWKKLIDKPTNYKKIFKHLKIKICAAGFIFLDVIFKKLLVKIYI